MFIFSVPCRQESMTFEIIVVTGVISGGRMGQNCREDLSKLLCQLLFICNWIARGSTSRQPLGVRAIKTERVAIVEKLACNAASYHQSAPCGESRAHTEENTCEENQLQLLKSLFLRGRGHKQIDIAVYTCCISLHMETVAYLYH